MRRQRRTCTRTLDSRTVRSEERRQDTGPTVASDNKTLAGWMTDRLLGPKSNDKLNSITHP